MVTHPHTRTVIDEAGEAAGGGRTVKSCFGIINYNFLLLRLVAFIGMLTETWEQSPLRLFSFDLLSELPF